MLNPRIEEIKLPFPFCSLNPMLRQHWANRNSSRKKYQDDVAFTLGLLDLKPFPSEHLLYFEWEWKIASSKAVFNKRDGDNISSAGRKLILDVLTREKLIKDDSLKHIGSPVLDWFERAPPSEESQVLVRISDVPLYQGQIINIEM